MHRGTREHFGNGPPFRWRHWWKTAAIASFSVVAAVSMVGPAQPASAAVRARAYGNGVHQIKATAYCLDGRMANGEAVHDGAAAMRGVPLGASVAILDGPDAGRTLVVKDRTPKRGLLDIWMDDCGAARQHGVQRVTIEVRG